MRDDGNQATVRDFIEHNNFPYKNTNLKPNINLPFQVVFPHLSQVVLKHMLLTSGGLKL